MSEFTIKPFIVMFVMFIILWFVYEINKLLGGKKNDKL
jgi:hypothetical protein